MGDDGPGRWGGGVVLKNIWFPLHPIIRKGIQGDGAAGGVGLPSKIVLIRGKLQEKKYFFCGPTTDVSSDTLWNYIHILE